MKEGYHSNPSDRSDKSDSSDNNPPLILPHGGYQKLRSFQVAQAVYDATLIFCDRFVEKRSRTHDQMVQAARSGVQNIAEGSMASATSSRTELKLTGVARASLVELLLDYKDFLRHRSLKLWPKDSPAALAVRRRYQSDKSDKSGKSDRSGKSDSPTLHDPFDIANASAEVAANTLVCLIHQATYLLHRQIKQLSQQFLEHGGVTERLYAARSQYRSQSSRRPHPGGRPELPPACPRCNQPMVARTARRGPNAGKPFWGCSTYPDCTGTRPADPPAPKRS